MKRKRSNNENTMQQQVNNNNTITGSSSCSTRNWDDLPPEIIHRIHSLLYQGGDSTTVIRTGLVSKAWQQSWSISPTLIFKDSFSSTKVIDIVANKLDDTLSRYDQQKLHIKSLLLLFFYISLRPHRLDIWLDKARRCGVQDIRLTTYDPCLTFDPYPIFIRPVVPETLFATKTLHTLILDGFDINLADDKTSVRCCSLKNLSLKDVGISEQTMKNIFTSCPLVETLKVEDCYMFKEIDVTNLHGLRLFKFHSDKTLVYQQTFKMTDAQAKSLTHLDLNSVCISDADFATFSSKFRFLRYLSIEGCPLLERINIKFDLLTGLKLRPENIKVANIDAPNLRTLDYRGKLQILTFTNNVTPGQLEFGDFCFYEVKNDTSWFLNLREVLREFHQCKVVIYYEGEEMSYHDVEYLRAMSSPVLEENVTQLSIQMIISPAMSADGTTTIDALFSICRPKYLFLGHTFTQHHERFVFLLKKLAAAGITNQNCCTEQATKCWLHYLIDAKIKLWNKLEFDEEHLEENDEAGWRPVGVAWKTIAGAPPTPAAVIKLEWIGYSRSFL